MMSVAGVESYQYPWTVRRRCSQRKKRLKRTRRQISKSAHQIEWKTWRSSLWRILCFSTGRGFIDLKNLICGNVTERLHNAARPMDFDACGLCIGSQSKVNPLVA